jgi:hypothetical protein
VSQGESEGRLAHELDVLLIKRYRALPVQVRKIHGVHKVAVTHPGGTDLTEEHLNSTSFSFDNLRRLMWLDQWGVMGIPEGGHRPRRQALKPRPTKMVLPAQILVIYLTHGTQLIYRR